MAAFLSTGTGSNLFPFYGSKWSGVGPLGASVGNRIAYPRILSNPYTETFGVYVASTQQIACGFADYPNNTPSTSTEFRARVTNALAVEAANNALSFTHLIGGTQYSVPDSIFWAGASAAQANGFFYARQVSDLRRFGEYTGPRALFGTVESPNWQPGTQVTRSSPLQVFGYIQAGQSQGSGDYALDSPFANSFTVAPGGWCFQWQSSAFLCANLFLSKGASCAVSCVAEPSAFGVPLCHMLAYFLLCGLTFAEASVRAGGQRSAAFGDPLYRPYRPVDGLVEMRQT
jgi:hypothetical protein